MVNLTPGHVLLSSCTTTTRESLCSMPDGGTTEHHHTSVSCSKVCQLLSIICKCIYIMIYRNKSRAIISPNFIAGITSRCRCKFRYVSNFTTTVLRTTVLHCDNNTCNDVHTFCVLKNCCVMSLIGKSTLQWDTSLIIFTARCYAECGYATVSRPSVRLSLYEVQVGYVFYADWSASKLISRLISLRFLLEVFPTSANLSNDNTPKLGWNRSGFMSKKTCYITETVQDRTTVTMTDYGLSTRTKSEIQL